jgi:hypothetical protein
MGKERERKQVWAKKITYKNVPSEVVILQLILEIKTL